MIIVKIQGGLGNQMFQYATVKAIAEDKQFYIDLSFIDSNPDSNEFYTARNLELKIFKHARLILINKLILKLYKSTRYKLANFRKLFNIRYITDEDFYLTSKSRKLYLDGYFQNPAYFEKIRNQLLLDFRFPPINDSLKQFKDIIGNAENAIAIHVRRGDYLKNINRDIFHQLNKTYYKSAIDYISGKVNNPAFFIFSDDIAWCRKNLHFDHMNITFMPFGSKNHDDMHLMSICKHQIIANSSFSWWAAWLNENNNKIVIAPKLWFKNLENYCIPKDWIQF